MSQTSASFPKLSNRHPDEAFLRIQILLDRQDLVTRQSLRVLRREANQLHTADIAYVLDRLLPG